MAVVAAGVPHLQPLEPADGRPGRRCAARGPGRPQLVPQDVDGELLQRGGRLEPQLVGEVGAVVVVALHRLAVPAREVERTHERLLSALAQRVVGDERLEHRGRLGGLPGVDEGEPAQLERSEAQVLEPQVLQRDDVVGELAVRLTAPQPERLVEQHPGPQPGRPCGAPGDQLLKRAASTCSGRTAST